MLDPTQFVIMKKLFVVTILFTTISFTGKSQEALDSIFTATEILAVNVKEVSEESIKYAYPGEDLVNSISTSKISKIVFKSGRTQVFEEERAFRTVRNGLDWEYVTVVQNDQELKGLYQLDQVNSKAKAATGWGSVGKMENRAKRKLLIETAMNGGNVVFLTQQNSSTRSQNSTSSSVMGGVAYTNTIPNIQLLQDLLRTGDELRFVEEHSLGVNSDDLKVSAQKGELVKLTNPEKSGHMIYVNANVPGVDETKFRVSYLDDKEVILVYRTKKQIVNVILMH